MKKQSTFFRDKNGKVVIFQFPNWPLWLVIALYVIQLIGNPSINFYCLWLSRILLVYWSYLEIRFGVDSFRRVLGIATLIYVLYGIFHL